MNIIKSNFRFNDAINYGKYLILFLMAILFLGELVLSLAWRIEGDAAYMSYAAFLVNNHGFIPYRDLFDINMPGSYLFFMALEKIVGDSHFIFRLLDVLWLTITLAITWFLMKPFSKITAWSSCLLFGLIYLGAGPHMSLQRDCVALLPIAIALLITTQRKPSHSVNIINSLLGILFGLAALIKPHMAIGLPAIFSYNYLDFIKKTKSRKKIIKTVLVGSLITSICFIITLVLPFIWLWKIDAIQSFLEIFSSFTPLYAKISGSLEFIDGLSRIKYILVAYLKFGGFEILVATSMYGLYHVWGNNISNSNKNIAILLFILVILYSFSAVVSGKLWLYHWMPFIYFTCLCTALIMCSPSALSNVRRSSILFSLSLFVFAVIVTVQPADNIFQQIRYGRTIPPYNGRVDEMTSYLKNTLLPDSTVQPLDWGGGVMAALFFSKAVVATPYICDFQFYVNVSNPYIQGLRRDFIIRLEQSMPDFIIDLQDRQRLSGVDTSYSFPQLDSFISQNYEIDYQGNGFEILRKIEL